MIHASESGHWYRRDGAPAYTVKAKDGSDRPATLRDARKLGLVPGVSTIIGCCAKPGLERWKLDQMMHAALTLPRRTEEPEAQWIDRVWADSQETARKARERGTKIHAAIQGHYEGVAPDPDLWPYVQGAVRAVREWLALPAWTAERSFACGLGFGGKADLSALLEAADFKTKEFGPDDDLKIFDEHAMQLAAYLEGLGIGVERGSGAICYVSTTHPGLARLIEIPREDLRKGWRMFCGLLDYWKAKTSFESGWIEKEAA